MAHYIADLIAKVESASGGEKRSAEKDCFDAVLALWQHRAELPIGKRPFEGLEPVARAIESLDPDNDTPRYFRSAWPPNGDREEESEAEHWLKMADGLDYSAKVLIRHCLAEAARASIDRSQEWVKLAQAAAADDGVSEIVLRFVSSAADTDQEPDFVAEQHRLAEGRLARLESFTKFAELVVNEWRRNLMLNSPSLGSRSGPRSKVKLVLHPKDAEIQK